MEEESEIINNFYYSNDYSELNNKTILISIPKQLLSQLDEKGKITIQGNIQF